MNKITHHVIIFTVINILLILSICIIVNSQNFEMQTIISENLGLQYKTIKILDTKYKSIVTSITEQLQTHWKIPQQIYKGDKIKNQYLKIEIEMSLDGVIESVKPITYNKECNIKDKAMLNSALRSIYKASPIKNLPPEHYERWKKTIVSFSLE